MLLLKNINEPLYVILNLKQWDFYKNSYKETQKIKTRLYIVMKTPVFVLINKLYSGAKTLQEKIIINMTQVENVKFWYFSFCLAKLTCSK